MEGSSTRHRVRKKKGWFKRRRIGTRVALIGGAIVLIVLIVASVLSFLTYEHVKDPLRSAQNTLTSLAHSPQSLNSAAGRVQVEVQLAAASNEVAKAQHEISGSTGLKILGIIPGLHTQREGLEQLVADLHTTTLSAIALLHSVDALATESHGTNISLPGLKDLGVTLGNARAKLAAENRPTGGLWGPIGTDRRKFDHEDSRAVHLLGQGEDVTKFALPFLGTDGPRSYLVMGENNAEMRDQGATLSYSLMNTNNGAIDESNGGTVNNIELTSPASGVTVPAGTQAVFGELFPTQTWQSTNATADFAFSGADMQAMYASATGQHVDGVLGIDVVALQNLLALTGPVTVSGVAEPVSSTNAAAILLNQLYAGLPPGAPQGPRREELGAVTSAAFHQLQSGNVDVVALARTLATEISERHLQLWDENPQFERTLREVGASGAIDTDDPSRTFHVAVENATATKLDYFVNVSIADTVHFNSDGSAIVDTSVTMVNHAPAGQPASYQLGPDGINSHVSGEYIGRVFLWGPRGSVQGAGVKESGLILEEKDLPVLPGQSATAQFQTVIPHAVQAGKLRLVFVPQPRLSPESLSVHVIATGLQRNSRPTRQALLTKTTALTWDFSGNQG